MYKGKKLEDLTEEEIEEFNETVKDYNEMARAYREKEDKRPRLLGP